MAAMKVVATVVVLVDLRGFYWAARLVETRAEALVVMLVFWSVVVLVVVKVDA